MPAPVQYRFEDIQVDPARFHVCKAGEILPLEPKSIRVLLHLIAHRDRVVPKEELIQAIWTDTFVTDNVLTRAVAQLRKSLQDDAKQPRYIETIPTIGYRFVASLEAHPGKQRRRFLIPAAAAFSLAAGWMVWKAGPAKPLHAGPLTQLTATPGLDLTPSFSPDGNSIAYSSDRTGRFEIYVKPLGPGSPEIQITSDGGQNLEPAWSPDGQALAYHSINKGGIFRVPALGGFPRRISPFGSQPAWSRDGSWVAFRSDSLYSLAVADFLPTSVSTIWVVPAAGGEPRRVTTPAHPPARHTSPSWSPDSLRILFISYGSLRKAQIWSAGLDGGDLRALDTGDQVPLHAVYGPDGRSVFYTAYSHNADWGIWRLELGGRRPVEVAQTGAGVPRDLALSADGRRLAYTLTSMSSNLWSLSLSSGQRRPLTMDTSLRNSHPVFSPDASRLAFFVIRQGIAGDIWLMNAGGGSPFAVTTDTNPEYMPSWTPDGKAIAYATRRGDRHSFWITTLADGVEKPLAPLDELAGRPQLSPDGKEIVYHLSKDGVLNLWKRDLATGKTTQLTFDPESMGYSCWSPDGQWIALETIRGEDTHLTLMPAGGGEPRQLTFERGQSWPHSWSPDGGKIAFAGFRDGAWNVWQYSLSSGQTRKLTDYTSMAGFVRYPAWSPRNDQIVYEQAETRGNIYWIEMK